MQWQQLSCLYADAAVELRAVLAAVSAGSWQGIGADRYIDAHGPYLAWLDANSTTSMLAASRHHWAAVAFDSALAAMPTPAELAANHALHAALTATNFFGINTIGLAANEADYLRMWIQAAETMTLYQVSAQAAAASVPASAAAPPLTTPGGEPRAWSELGRFVTDVADFIANPYQYFQAFFQRFGLDPVTTAALAVIALLLYDVLWYPYYAAYALLLAPFFAPALSALSALALLFGDFDLPVFGITSAVPAALPGHAGGSGLPGLPGSLGAAGPVAGAPAAQPSATTSAPASAPTAEPWAALPYLVPGFRPPAVGSGPTARSGSTQAVASAAAAAASVAAVRRTQQRRRTTGTLRGHRDEFVHESLGGQARSHADDAVAPSSSASTQGAGSVGIGAAMEPPRSASVAGRGAVETGASGFAVTGDTGTLPLLPGTWDGSTRESLPGG